LFTFTNKSGKWRIEIHVKKEMCGVPQKKKKQILQICRKLEIAGQLDVYVTSARVSSPILILNLRLLKVQPGRELSREPFLRAVRV